MPGPFAHFTLFHQTKERFMAQPLYPEVQQALGDFYEFGLLGSNSPDFPVVTGDRLWEEYLHGPTAANYIRPALVRLRPLSPPARAKFLAWFLGYLSHMTGDATIHPVVNLRVGPYIGNEKAHQICEIHQDAHIYPRLGLVGVTKCNFTRLVIDACCADSDRLTLAPDLSDFWRSLSLAAFPKAKVPNFNRWFAIYTGVVEKLAEESDWFHIRFGAKIFRKKHLLQITPSQIDQSYIQSLPAPFSRTVSYDDLFDAAIENTLQVWLSFASALANPDSFSFPLSTVWDLNTGASVDQKFLFWEMGS